MNKYLASLAISLILVLHSSIAQTNFYSKEIDASFGDFCVSVLRKDAGQRLQNRSNAPAESPRRSLDFSDKKQKDVVGIIGFAIGRFTGCLFYFPLDSKSPSCPLGFG